jgi:trk system potassium uptake protein TrkA
MHSPGQHPEGGHADGGHADGAGEPVTQDAAPVSGNRASRQAEQSSLEDDGFDG